MLHAGKRLPTSSGSCRSLHLDRHRRAHGQARDTDPRAHPRALQTTGAALPPRFRPGADRLQTAPHPQPVRRNRTRCATAPGNCGCLIPDSGSHGTRRRPSGTERCPFDATRRPVGTELRPLDTARRPVGTALCPLGTARRRYVRASGSNDRARRCQGTAFRPFTFACPGMATTPGSFSCTPPVVSPLQRRITSADRRSSRGRSPKATLT